MHLTPGYVLQLAALTALCLSLSPANCSAARPQQASWQEARPNTAARPGPMKVALLVSGPVTDHGWNQTAYQGLLRLRRERVARIAWRRVGRPDRFASSFRDYARQGYDLVIGHGEEFAGAVAHVAPEFPRTVFVTTGGRTVLANAAPIEIAMEEPAYLLGMLAAGISRTGRAALLGGERVPQLQQAFAAFESGARSVKPKFQVSVDYLGSWTDAPAARRWAQRRMREGADILFPNADATGLAVLRAARESRRPRVYAFGANGDQSRVAPRAVLASAVLDMPRVIVQVAREVQRGGFVSRVHHFGLREGAVDVLYNPRLRGTVPAWLRQRVDRARRAIRAGALRVAPAGDAR
jgi:basic membrane protein A